MMGSLVLQFGFTTLQFTDFTFIGSDHGWIGGVDDALQQGIHLLFNSFDLVLAGFNDVFDLRQTLRPRIAEHDFDQLKQVLAGLQGFGLHADVAFQLIARD